MKIAKRIYITLCCAVFAIAMLLLAIYPWFQLTINVSKSLPGKLYLMHKGAAVNKGDTVAFYWQGGATYPAGTIFIKRIVGVAGDFVTRSDTAFWVNNQYIGIAKPTSRADVPLTASPEGIVQPGTYFVATPHPDSLDSRYTVSGNIHQHHVIGKAYAIF